MGTPFFSVIVPVYNVQAYLAQCLDSVLVQNFTDFELILVNDGSTDGSGAVCDAYGKTDQRIHVIHKKNGGLSEARNAGLEAASGSYIWFLDSDDFLLEQSAFKIVAGRINQENADVVFFSYKKFYEGPGRYSESMYAHVPDHANIEEWIKTNAYKALGCNKVVRRGLIIEHNLRFPVGRTGEDLGWCADLLAYAGKITLCKKDLLAYRQRPGSITTNKDREFKFHHMENVLFLMNETASKYLPGNPLVGHYLGYEFSWLLGEGFPFWETCGGKIKNLAFLLDYDLCGKTAKVQRLKRILGLKNTAWVLYLFIKMKKRREK